MVQEILARELNNMSLDDHEKVVFDVHGIAHVPKEDPEILQEQLERLKVELDRVTGNEAYLKVNKINPEFANQYRLMFLRGEKYDVTLASKKLVQHFDVKRQLFGEGPIMTRDIRQSDLSPNGKRILESGFMQASNERDSSGRAIVFMTSQYHKDGITALDLGQSILYYGMRTLRDDETLRNGMVWVFYNLNNVAVQKKYMEYVYLVEKSLAGRISALHYCYTEETLWPYVAGLQLFFAESDRFRLRPFMGSLQEIEFYLQTFGIPTHLSPLREDGSWCLEWLHESLEAMRLREETEMQMERAGVVIPALLDASSCKTSETTTSDVPCTESIVIPRRFDVILGKSAHARVHTGNRRAIHLCQMNFEAYEEANKFRKTEVAERIVSIIRESGGRFLRWEESGGRWVEETDEITARKKIGHFLRYMRSKVGKEDNEAASLTEMNGKATKRLSLFPLPPLGPTTEESVHSEIPPKRAYRVSGYIQSNTSRESRSVVSGKRSDTNSL